MIPEQSAIELTFSRLHNYPITQFRNFQSASKSCLWRPVSAPSRVLKFVYALPCYPHASIAPRRSRCAPSCVKPVLRRKASSTRYSSARAKACARKSRSMPGVFNLSVDEAVKECREVKSLGIPAVILFGLPEKKDEVATGAWAEDGIVQRATRAIKATVPGLMVVGDVCLCEYMSHGHCGIVKPVARPERQRVMVTRATGSGSHGKGGRGRVRDRQRRQPGDPGEDRRLPGQGGNGHHCPLRHDGRPCGRYPHGAGCEWVREHPHAQLRRQVCQRLLWPLPRSGRLRAAVRRPPQLPDGSGQLPRSHPRDRTRPRRRRGHDHGEAGAALPGHHRRGAPAASTCRSPPTRSPASTP